MFAPLWSSQEAEAGHALLTPCESLSAVCRRGVAPRSPTNDGKGPAAATRESLYRPLWTPMAALLALSTSRNVDLIIPSRSRTKRFRPTRVGRRSLVVSVRFLMRRAAATGPQGDDQLTDLIAAYQTCPTTGRSQPRGAADQNTDQPVRRDRLSSASAPTSELPASFSPGAHTAMDALRGAIARMPPPTPLLPGRPTRKAKSPEAS